MLTQDPIGLAGGVNLYAYAGSNPVAYSDPFGLCPDPGRRGAALCNWIRATITAAGTDIGAAFGGGAGLVTGPGAVVASPAGAVAGATIGAGIGLAAGTAITNVLFRDDQGSSASDEPERDPAAGLRRQLEEHQQKLERFRENPDAFDNKGFLRNASPELRERIIQGRIRNLENQIKNFQEQIRAIESR